MATNKQIVKAADDFEEAQKRLSDLRDRKQTLQDQLADINAEIAQQQIVMDDALVALRVIVNSA
jgi:uncharacterized coiled-coil protein SlyX